MQLKSTFLKTPFAFQGQKGRTSTLFSQSDKEDFWAKPYVTWSWLMKVVNLRVNLLRFLSWWIWSYLVMTVTVSITSENDLAIKSTWAQMINNCPMYRKLWNLWEEKVFWPCFWNWAFLCQNKAPSCGKWITGIPFMLQQQHSKKDPSSYPLWYFFEFLWRTKSWYVFWNSWTSTVVYSSLDDS